MNIQYLVDIGFGQGLNLKICGWDTPGRYRNKTDKNNVENMFKMRFQT